MDANSFDLLSKRLGSTSSRRHSIRALFGFALLGTSLTPSAEFELAEARRHKQKRQESVGQNPVADTVLLGEGSPQVEGELFDPCPERVSRPGYTPTLNGCGSDFFDVPDSAIFSSQKVNFTAVCNEHDKCYGTCNSDRNLCDLRLAADMEKACDRAYLKKSKKSKKSKKKKGGSRSDSRQHRLCLAQADIYWATLKSVGWKAYNDAQEDACICCKAGEIACKDKCVNTQTDRNNCGACGKVCPGGQDCALGNCSGVEYELELEWFVEDTAGQEDPSLPEGIAVSPDGQFVYVADALNDVIKKYTNSGALIDVWQHEGLMSDDGSPAIFSGYELPAEGIAVDSQGNIYTVGELYFSTILKLQPNGQPSSIFVGHLKDWQRYPSATVVEALHRPSNIAVDGSENMYVPISDGGWGEQGVAIMKISPNGAVLRSWKRTELTAGGADGIAITNDGTVYISSGNAFDKIAADGTVIKSWTYDMDCMGLAVDQSNGNILAIDPEGNQVIVFDGDGALVTSWGKSGTGPGEFDRPDGITVGPDGAVYVADTFNRRIQKFRRVQTRA